MTDLEIKAWQILKKNRVVGSSFAYTRPGGKYRHQFFWDSCFHALVLRHFDPDFAKRELLSLFRFQDESGFTPHLSFHTNPSLGTLFWGRWGSSGLIQPPIVAEAACAVFEADHDIAFLEQIYPHLVDYYDFLLSVRDHDHDHLFSYVHPWESGWDQSIEWDFAFRTHWKVGKQWRFALSRMTLPLRALGWDQKRIVKRAHFNVETVDGNTLLSVNLDRLAKIADILDRGKEAKAWKEAGERVKEAILTQLWNGEMFVDEYLIDHEHKIIQKRTPVVFFPLLLPGLRTDQKKKLLSLLIQEFLKVACPLPTVAPSEPSFNPNGYWRGTTWINVNYFVIRGLWQQGEKELGDDLLKQTTRLIERVGFCEYYNPLTGAGLGERDFSWSTLVVDLLKRKAARRG